LIPALARGWAALGQYDPALPWVLLPTLLWLGQWAVRCKWPGAWEALARLGPTGAAASKAWQALPSSVIGCVVCAATVGIAPRDLALAAVVSNAAPVAHELLRYVTERVPFLPTYLGGNYPAAGSAAKPPTPTIPEP
jgi:hypothetical protein